MTTIIMQVHKYIPARLFGFAIADDGSQIFFHLGAFDPGKHSNNPPCIGCPDCTWGQMPPPPILGEKVEVQLDASIPASENRAPRALRVRRLATPVILSGVVETFDPYRGYGFIKGSDGNSYHLHKSEIVEGRLPFVGMKVKFYAGQRKDKPRACYVKVCT